MPKVWHTSCTLVTESDDMLEYTFTKVDGKIISITHRGSGKTFDRVWEDVLTAESMADVARALKQSGGRSHIIERIEINPTNALRITAEFNFARSLDLFALLFSADIRERVWAAVADELKAEFLHARKKYRTKWARRWIVVTFTVRTTALVLETIRVSAVGRILRMLPLAWQHHLRNIFRLP